MSSAFLNYVDSLPLGYQVYTFMACTEALNSPLCDRAFYALRSSMDMHFVYLYPKENIWIFVTEPAATIPIDPASPRWGFDAVRNVPSITIREGIFLTSGVYPVLWPGYWLDLSDIDKDDLPRARALARSVWEDGVHNDGGIVRNRPLVEESQEMEMSDVMRTTSRLRHEVVVNEEQPVSKIGKWMPKSCAPSPDPMRGVMELERAKQAKDKEALADDEVEVIEVAVRCEETCEVDDNDSELSDLGENFEGFEEILDMQDTRPRKKRVTFEDVV